MFVLIMSKKIYLNKLKANNIYDTVWLICLNIWSCLLFFVNMVMVINGKFESVNHKFVNCKLMGNFFFIKITLNLKN